MQIYRKKSTEFVNLVTYLTLFLYIRPKLSRKRGDDEATESAIELVRSGADKFGIGASYVLVSCLAVLDVEFLTIGEMVGIGHLPLISWWNTNQGETPIGCLSLLYTHVCAKNYQAVPSSEVACYDSQNTFCGK